MAIAALHRWGARHLLGAWVTYWAALALVALGGGRGRPLLRLALDPARHGSVTAALGDGRLQMTVLEQGGATWSGTLPVLPLLLWVIAPPLLLFGLWLLSRSTPGAPHDALYGTSPGASAPSHPVRPPRTPALANPADRLGSAPPSPRRPAEPDAFPADRSRAG